MAKDPVCGMETDQLAENMLEHEGRIFFFCSDECKARFKADPAKYLTGRKAKAAAMESHAHHGGRHGCC